jgi:hypothetical protein
VASRSRPAGADSKPPHVLRLSRVNQVDGLSRRVNQAVGPANRSSQVGQFSCRRCSSGEVGGGGLDRDGHDARVNYVGGWLESLETLAAACFCR